MWLTLVLALIHNWHMHLIDFIMAFRQVPIKIEIFMQQPNVLPNFAIPNLPLLSDQLTEAYHLLQNLCSLKDAGCTWFKYLSVGLLVQGWSQSFIDGCLFTKEDLILLVYIDNTVLISPHPHK